MSVYLFRDPRNESAIFSWDTAQATLSLNDSHLGELQRYSRLGELLYRFLEHKNLSPNGQPKNKHYPDSLPIRDFQYKLLKKLQIAVHDRPKFLKSKRNVSYIWLPESISSEDEWRSRGKGLPDLVLSLHAPRSVRREDTSVILSYALLTFHPSHAEARIAKSSLFSFEVPPSPIDQDDLHWYLSNYDLPLDALSKRARRIASALPEWGRRLFKAALAHEAAQHPLKAWLNESGERRFTVEVDFPASPGYEEHTQCACRLLSLPWELLHDGQMYLFQGRYSVRVRRRPLNRRFHPPLRLTPPVRILLVSPRPEDELSTFIDHRISSQALLSAVEDLGHLAELTVLSPPTFSQLRESLERAQSDRPFHVVHFDGQGLYHPDTGLGMLCFECSGEIDKPYFRTTDLVPADQIAGMMAEYRVPFVFLEAIQCKDSGDDVVASIAAWLLEAGVASVVGMNQSVMAETIRLFTKELYRSLARGSRIGTAMLTGQRALFENRERRYVPKLGTVALDDWFVPVLYQEENDPVLFSPIALNFRSEMRPRPGLNQHFPEDPPHGFVGRARESLALERLLLRRRYVVLQGQGGAGKTTMAINTARWLWRVGQFQRVAFISVEHITEPSALIAEVALQLNLTESSWSVARFKTVSKAIEDLMGRLQESCLIVIDNMESILPELGIQAPGAVTLGKILTACQDILTHSKTTRLLFTSREPLPEPFDRCPLILNELNRSESIQLIKQTLCNTGTALDPQEEHFEDLASAVGGHARALVLLTKEASSTGFPEVLDDFSRALQHMDENSPNDRQRSLFASLYLSINRLPKDIQGHLPYLGACHLGINLFTLPTLLGTVSQETIHGLAERLIQVGLANRIHPDYLRLDPALGTYYERMSSESTLKRIRRRWAEAMKQLTEQLYQQEFHDAESASDLIKLDLPNILAFLQWTLEHWKAESVVRLADRLSTFLNRLDRPRAQEFVSAIKNQASDGLFRWNHSAYLAAESHISALKDQGRSRDALDASKALVEKALAAGEDAYPEAIYDLGSAFLDHAIMLTANGEEDQAFLSLKHAERYFEEYAKSDARTAKNLLGCCSLTRGEICKNLRRLTDAREAFSEAMTCFNEAEDTRNQAIAQTNLADVLQFQGHINEAIEYYQQAIEIFVILEENHPLATTLRHLATACVDANMLTKAESALRRALELLIKINDYIGQGKCLQQMGKLYKSMGKVEARDLFRDARPRAS